MKGLLYALTILIAFLITSCSSPMDKAYNEDTLQEDVVALKGSLSEDELGLIIGQITMNSLSGDKMLGDTYGDLLEEGKKRKQN